MRWISRNSVNEISPSSFLSNCSRHFAKLPGNVGSPLLITRVSSTNSSSSMKSELSTSNVAKHSFRMSSRVKHEYLCEEEEKGEGMRLCEREMRKDTTRRHT